MRRVSELSLGALPSSCPAAALRRSTEELRGREHTRRLCDRRLTYDVVPPVDVPADLGRLSGVWKGTVIMAGGSEMCVAMVVKEVSRMARSSWR